MALEGDETELFGTSYQVRAITDQPQLETIFRWRAGNLLLQRGETACLHSAIRIDEYQHRPVGGLNSFIPGNRNPGVFLTDYGDRKNPAPVRHEFGRRISTAVIDYYHLKTRAVLLLCQRI